MRLKLASRSSDLARWQAKTVGARIEQHHPEVQIEYIFKSSFGDQNLDLPLSQMESRGVFTQDFYSDLKEGKYDFVVHSWKDLPVEDREGTEVYATLERADVRDVLLVPMEVWQKAQKSLKLQILTSSPRRIYNLQEWLPQALPRFTGEIEFIPVRGNIPSRLGKMFSQSCGLILAKAALDRMLAGGEAEFEQVKNKVKEEVLRCHFMILPIEVNPCAPAQGALAIEVASHREDLKSILNTINDHETFKRVQIERDILKSYGGGCHQKIGVTHLPKPFGVFHVEKGESDWGIKLDRKELLKETAYQNWREWGKDQVFPLKPEENSWFDREAIDMDHRATAGRAVLVARVTEDLNIGALTTASQVWVSGLKSWSKLAKKGIWVNGCFEGMGEEEQRWVGPFAQGLNWIKLTHEGAKDSSMATLPYYRLIPQVKEKTPSLKGKKFFYWMSASSFQRALELYPEEVQNGIHACGPGQTFQALKSHSALNQEPFIFLSLEEYHDYLRHNGLRL